MPVPNAETLLLAKPEFPTEKERNENVWDILTARSIFTPDWNHFIDRENIKVFIWHPDLLFMPEGKYYKSFFSEQNNVGRAMTAGAKEYIFMQDDHENYIPKQCSTVAINAHKLAGWMYEVDYHTLARLDDFHENGVILERDTTSIRLPDSSYSNIHGLHSNNNIIKLDEAYFYRATENTAPLDLHLCPNKESVNWGGVQGCRFPTRIYN